MQRHHKIRRSAGAKRSLVRKPVDEQSPANLRDGLMTLHSAVGNGAMARLLNSRQAESAREATSSQSVHVQKAPNDTDLMDPKDVDKPANPALAMLWQTTVVKNTQSAAAALGGDKPDAKAAIGFVGQALEAVHSLALSYRAQGEEQTSLRLQVQANALYAQQKMLEPHAGQPVTLGEIKGSIESTAERMTSIGPDLT